MAKVFLSIGTNLGARFKNVQECIRLIQSNPSMQYISCSKIYETLPMYNLKQNNFLNLIIKIQTTIKPIKLLDEIKLIELKMGRGTNSLRNQPRLIDIDILSYGDDVFHSQRLTIPHPGIIERIFVLKPWNDIAPDYKLPKINKTISELTSTLDIDSNTIKLYNKSL